jgi:hypothetical protein
VREAGDKVKQLETARAATKDMTDHSPRQKLVAQQEKGESFLGRPPLDHLGR